MASAKELLKPSSLGAFKELVETIEQSKQQRLAQEFRSEEELNNLKQTSSLVAKFQEEAVSEKQNRLSAELQAQEKDRLASDAWKIISALKKDKYSLELQIEKLKSEKEKSAQLVNGIGSSSKTPAAITESKSSIDKNKQQRKNQAVATGDGKKRKEKDGNALGKKENERNQNQMDMGDSNIHNKRVEKNRYNFEKKSVTTGNKVESSLLRVVNNSQKQRHQTVSSDDTPGDLISIWSARPHQKTSVDGTDDNEEKISGTRITKLETDSQCRGEKKVTEPRGILDEGLSSHFVTDRKCKPDERRRVRENLAANGDFDKHDDGRTAIGRFQAPTYDSRPSEKMSYTFGTAEPLRKSSLHRGKPVEKTRAKERYLEGVADDLNDSTKATLKSILKTHIDERRMELQKSGELEKDVACTEGKARPSEGLRGGVLGKRVQDLARRIKVGHGAAVPRGHSAQSGLAVYEDLRDPQPGLCGLENLGNTCFMNAGLQCLFVIKPFQRFFLSGGHKNQNATKHHDKSRFSECLGRLIDKVWSGCYLICEPSALYSLAQKYIPQLSGYSQHDCQEFLALFLEVLHQELNTAKPRMRRSLTNELCAKDAESWWSLYTDKNESIIVDTFQGQFRNKITCTACSHVSVTYQAFSFLSLPLASQKLQTFIVTFVGHAKMNSDKPRALRLRIYVRKPSTAMQVKRALVGLLPPDERPDLDTLILGVVSDGALLAILSDNETISPSKDKQNKYYAFEPVPPPLSLVSNCINTKDNDQTTKLRPNKDVIMDEPHRDPKQLGSRKHRDPDHLGSRKHKYDDYGAVGCAEGDVVDPSGRGRRREGRASFPEGYHLTFTCSLCLEDRTNAMLLTHDGCGRMFCRQCLGVMLKDADITIDCPICTRRSNTSRSLKHRFRFHNIPVMFKHRTEDEDVGCLFSHPVVVTLPQRVTGHDLYGHLSRLLPGNNNKRHEITALPFTLHLVNYEGKNCSRCPPAKYCTGCCIVGNDVIDLRWNDHIAIQLTNLTRLEMDKMSRFSDHDSIRAKTSSSCKLQLQDCLRTFVDREELEDLWPCSMCNAQRTATKSLSVCRFPDTLIVHLKRYRHSNQKIMAPVDYPLEELDMREFMQSANSPRDSSLTNGEYVYDLIGCICHEGDHDSGHYKAYTRHGRNADWYLFDDHLVSKEFPGSSTNKTVYLLFYNKRSGSSLNASAIDDKLVQRLHQSVTEKKSAEPPLLKKQEIPAEYDVVTDPPPHSWKDMIDSKENSTSTPLERPKERRKSHQEKTKEVVKEVKANAHAHNAEPAKCDCSQCDYLRGLEHQLKLSKKHTDSSDPSSDVQHISHRDPHEQQRDNPSYDHQEEQVIDENDKGPKHRRKRRGSSLVRASSSSPYRSGPYSDKAKPKIDRVSSKDSGERVPSRGQEKAKSERGVSARKEGRGGDHSATADGRHEERLNQQRDVLFPIISSDSLDEVDSDQFQAGVTRRLSARLDHYETSCSSEETLVRDAATNTEQQQNKMRPQSHQRDSRNSINLSKLSSSPHQKDPKNAAHFQPKTCSNHAKDSRDSINSRNLRDSRHLRDAQLVPSSGSNTLVSTTSVESAVQCNLLDHNNNLDENPEPVLSRKRTGVDSGVQVTLSDDEDLRRDNMMAERVTRVSASDPCIEISVDSETALVTQKLVLAVENEDIKRVLRLMQKGADPSLLIDGVSALHIAVAMTSSLGYHLTRLFLDAGADPNVRSVDGLTPVHVAAMWGKKECLKLLLSRGGNPYDEDDDGLTAIDLAKAFEQDTSADTSEYLSKLDEHYSSAINSDTLSEEPATSTDLSEMKYLPYLHGEDVDRQHGRRPRERIPEYVVHTPEPSLRLEGCGSWTKRARRRMKKSKLMRQLSGSVRRTSSSFMSRLRSVGEYLSTSSTSIRH
ncbi:uncharacterized protein LOC5508150 isoform X2 [Nematostella vectensis]|uniref:uncharacterized protein LOC5508150 isoform X2 n=1 Tax=Nematostella vectensis TaxID=45351 RepID=UPI002077282B|nr:uncharacterized protein LOC5508150 isoform X2 [Nematostella vectensis]